jgi:mannose-1-phosphate guanylyltransferase/phosphomannomutase
MTGAWVDRGAILEGACFVGEGSRVCAGARIGAGSVLGAGCVVEKNASVKRSVVWRGALIGEGAQVRGAVVQTGATVGARASIFEGRRSGRPLRAGRGLRTDAGVKVWPGKRIEGGSKLDQNWSGARGGRTLFAPESPAQAVRLAQAFAAALKPGSVVIGRDNSLPALAQARAASAGLIAQGVQCSNWGLRRCPAAHAVGRWTRAANVRLPRPANAEAEGGATPTGAQMRALSGALSREDYARPYSPRLYAPVLAGGGERSYRRP